MRGQFKRIQFTPDLVPADLVGTRIYNQRTGDFAPRSGRCSPTWCSPTRSTVRPPKVQSALLEVMQERQVTIDGETHQRAAAVPRDGDAEPDRDRRHLPAARGAGRPLHDEGAGRLSGPTRRSSSSSSASSAPQVAVGGGGEHRPVGDVAARVPGGVRRPLVDPVRGPAGRGDAPPRQARVGRDRPLPQLRCEPARPRST